MPAHGWDPDWPSVPVSTFSVSENNTASLAAPFQGNVCGRPGMSDCSGGAPGRPRPVPLDLRSITGRASVGSRSPTLTMKRAGKVVWLEAKGGGGEPHIVERGAIREWSSQSRRTCVRQISAAPWERYPWVLFGGLTYPGKEAVGFIPSDGRACQAHWKAFEKRWAREWGKPRGFWKREFQAREGEWEHPWQRCAPHFHFWVVVEGRLLDVQPERPEFEEWVKSTWAEVVGSGSPDHFEHGASCELMREGGDGVVGYVKGYLRKHADKEYQNQVPDGFENPGRFWGWMGGFRPEWEVEELSPGEFVRVRRVARRFLRSRGVRVRQRGRDVCGMVAICRAGFVNQIREVL